MKIIRSTALVCLAAASMCAAQNATPQKMVMREAATHEQLAARLHNIEAEDPMKKLKPAEGPDPAASLPKDIIGRSDVLCFGGLATLVPKQAILFTPSNYADRVGIQPGARVVGWSDFYAANRGWIITQDITMAQAEGKEPLPEKIAEKLTKGTNLIIATFQGGPISKIAPPPAQDAAAPKP
jgi:hypothetical protein